MKFVRDAKQPKLDASWFDKPSDTIIELGDGKPPFTLDVDATEFEKSLPKAGDGKRDRSSR